MAKCKCGTTLPVDHSTPLCDPCQGDEDDANEVDIQTYDDYDGSMGIFEGYGDFDDDAEE